MNQKSAKYRYTTADQRKLLFESWEATGNVSEACQKAHVGRRTFYYWKPRFEEQGYAGVEEFESRARHQPRGVAEGLKSRVLEHRTTNPTWGKLRIAEELAKENNWVPVISPNTVRHILQVAGLWVKLSPKQKNRAGVDGQQSRLGRP